MALAGKQAFGRGCAAQLQLLQATSSSRIKAAPATGNILWIVVGGRVDETG